MKHGASEIVDAGCYTMSVIVRYLPRTIRVRLFKLVYCFEQVRCLWAFLKEEWLESWKAYDWAFAFGDYATKLEFWIANADTFAGVIEKRAYRGTRKRLLLN
jgi:hypothetical protein